MHPNSHGKKEKKQNQNQNTTQTNQPHTHRKVHSPATTTPTHPVSAAHWHGMLGCHASTTCNCYIEFLLVGMFYLSMSFKPKYKTKCKRQVGISLILQYKEQLQDERKREETRLLKMCNCYPNANNTFQILCRDLYCTYGFKIKKPFT